MTEKRTKTSLENITLFHLCYFAIISIRVTSTETANYPRAKLAGVAFELRKRMKNLRFQIKDRKRLRVGRALRLLCFNPSSSNSDQHQISPCNINVYSTTEIKNMIVPKVNFLDILIASPQYLCKLSMGIKFVL